jgi:hypothetical protein
MSPSYSISRSATSPRASSPPEPFYMKSTPILLFMTIIVSVVSWVGAIQTVGGSGYTRRARMKVSTAPPPDRSRASIALQRVDSAPAVTCTVPSPLLVR